jgi:hypothetical protein
METFADKVKSFKDIKKEMKALFSINGYSEALGTNSLFKKVFWFIAFIALFASCMVVVDRNVKGFKANDVVTQFKVIDFESMTFPGVTFCITDFNFRDLIFVSKNLSSKLINCTFESQPCTERSDFRPIQFSFLNQTLDCYSFNSEKNGKLLATEVGSSSGLEIRFNLSTENKLFFKVHDNNERPTFGELNDIVEQNDGKFISVEMKKTIETKEASPYSNCTQNIFSDTSHLVKKILQQNITYRQNDCYERCFEEYLDKYRGSQKLTNLETNVLKSKFYYIGNCSNLCPLECTSTSFYLIKNEINLNSNDSKLLILNFFYSDRKYTEITQSVKVTGADFISNTGGVLGLFLELSFFSAYRFILFIFDLIFV